MSQPRPLDARDAAAILVDATQVINRQIAEVVSYSVGIHKSTGDRVADLTRWHQMIEQHLQIIAQGLVRIDGALAEILAELRAQRPAGPRD